MRILCAIGIRRGAELVRRLSHIARPGDELVLVHVLDDGPRHDLNHLEGTIRPHHAQREELDAAEQDAGSAALKEAAEAARAAGLSAVTRLERGRPEQAVVALAAQLAVDMVAVLAREAPGTHPLKGPPSIGHTARFILDHVAADVAVFREKG
ncbi:MAG TPA: universal stress protein [bacterium]|nr:universal stress protein [Spirochaetia bacterium]HUJ75441.1 universal stress protein [bacterium]